MGRHGARYERAALGVDPHHQERGAQGGAAFTLQLLRRPSEVASAAAWRHSRDQSMLHQSTIAEPQVKPEPNATIATFIPGFKRPSRCASCSRLGMVAAVV